MPTSDPHPPYAQPAVRQVRHRRGQPQHASERGARLGGEARPQLYHEILQHLPGGVALIRASDGLFLYTNPAFASMLGCAAGDSAGRFSEIIRAQDARTREELLAALDRELGVCGLWAGDIELQRYDGGSLWCHSVISHFEHREHGRVWLSLHEDISARKGEEDKLRAANLQLHLQIDQLLTLHDQLRDMALRDPLTKLFNRHYLHETLPREVARALRKGYPLAVLMIDIDHFKRVNDTYGHVAGDEALGAVAGLILSNLRASDIACRYGGEEILCVLIDADRPTAMRRAEELRVAIAELEVIPRHPEARLTVSLGVAIYPPSSQSIGDTILWADRALYRAKDAGRNCICLWDGKERFDGYADEPAG